MKRTISAALAAMLITGCMTYTRNGQPADQYDMLACEYEATKATAGQTSMAAAWDAGVIRRQCMFMRGYQLERVK